MHHKSQYSSALIAFSRVVVGAAWPWFGRYEEHGFEQVPLHGPVIVAPNHVSYYDPILVARAIRRPVYFLAWKQLFRTRLFSAVIRRMGAVPLDSERGSDRVAYATALRLLKEGDAVTIFPEGLRGWDGALNPLRPGVGRLAVATGAPIMPVWIEGAFEAWPRWQRFPRPFVPLSIHCGAPILPSSGGGQLRAAPRIEAELLTRQLEQELLRLAKKARHHGRRHR